ncbi:MAG: hypothetical protein NT066_05110 [Candidatus Omnitrophica bacterium]|nr:hypothetical protein [Candidatus Omnitrophota bacterium]
MKIKKIKLPFRIRKTILGLGSQSKNTICLLKNNLAHLSPIHPDLSHPKDFFSFEKDARHFLKENPKIIAYDMHPEYQSSKYALNLSPITYRLSPIQHHHAHIASCMLENGLGNQKVIGVAFDGTGLGTGNKLWGAEFLVCDYKNFTRKAHLKEIPLVGGEMAILEPLRVALIWLYLIYKDRFLSLGINFTRDIDKKKWQVFKSMYLAGVNAPLASSMGRLFDAVASIVLVKYRASFEGELAIELEKTAQAASAQTAYYNFRIIKDKEDYIIDPGPLFKEIIQDLKAGKPKARIAYCFHLSVARMVRKTGLILRKKTGINKVVLSGGVFQNSLLLNLTLGLLYKQGFEVFTHKNLSCNDSGISLGQAVIASFGG